METGSIYRTRTLNNISESDIGSELKIAGWVENIRDHGGVSFIDLRDMYGVMQVVMRDTSLLSGINKEDLYLLRDLYAKGMRRHIILKYLPALLSLRRIR